MFEVFVGAEKKDKALSDRFASVGDEDETVPVFVRSFPFTELPATQDDFIRALKERSWLSRRNRLADALRRHLSFSGSLIRSRQ
ncbi:hypothetical protein VTN96DRAFT_6681 [Rasamsonia emersonii]